VAEVRNRIHGRVDAGDPSQKHAAGNRIGAHADHGLAGGEEVQVGARNRDQELQFVQGDDLDDTGRGVDHRAGIDEFGADHAVHRRADESFAERHVQHADRRLRVREMGLGLGEPGDRLFGSRHGEIALLFRG